MKTEATADFCPRCGAPKSCLTILGANATTGWPMSPDAAHVVKCGECGCTTRVTPARQDDGKSISHWRPSNDKVESALTDIRYNAQQLKEQGHPDIGTTVLELTDKISRNYHVISNDRRETVYEATNRILEHAPGAELDNGEGNKQYHKIEDAIDDILSTIGVPDRAVNQ